MRSLSQIVSELEANGLFGRNRLRRPLETETERRDALLPSALNGGEYDQNYDADHQYLARELVRPRLCFLSPVHGVEKIYA
jgi:hypothetical protein